MITRSACGHSSLHNRGGVSTSGGQPTRQVNDTLTHPHATRSRGQVTRSTRGHQALSRGGGGAQQVNTSAFRAGDLKYACAACWHLLVTQRQARDMVSLVHPGVELRANRKSISHRCHLFEVAFVWGLTKETIHLPLGCLQGGSLRRNREKVCCLLEIKILSERQSCVRRPIKSGSPITNTHTTPNVESNTYTARRGNLAHIRLHMYVRFKHGSKP